MIKLFSSLLGWLPVSLLEKWLGYLERKDSNAANVTMEQIKAEVDIRRQNAEADVAIRKAVAEKQLVDKARWETRWIRPAFALQIWIYTGMVTYDNLNLEAWGTPSWTVDAFPPSLEWLPITIITTYFLARPVEKYLKGKR